MSIVEDAYAVLAAAEQSLKALIEQATKKQAYADVATVASMAAQLSRLIPASHPPASDEFPKKVPSDSTRGKTAPVASSASATRKKDHPRYPRFEREGDRMVKVGWSKKNREAYEHRASKKTLLAFVRHLALSVQVGTLFSVEDILPVHDATTGSELPAYQVYLGIAWLRDVAIVEKKGRDGYVLREDGVGDEEGFERLWEAVPQRKE